MARLYQSERQNGHGTVKGFEKEQFSGGGIGELETTGNDNTRLSPVAPANTRESSLSFKHLPSSLQKRRKILKLRSILISGKIVALQDSLINKRMTLRDSPYVYLAPRSSATMLWKRSFCSKKLPKSLSARESTIKRSYWLCKATTPPSYIKETRPSGLFYISEVSSVARHTTWSILSALSMRAEI